MHSKIIIIILISIINNNCNHHRKFWCIKKIINMFLKTSSVSHNYQHAKFLFFFCFKIIQIKQWTTTRERGVLLVLTWGPLEEMIVAPTGWSAGTWLAWVWTIVVGPRIVNGLIAGAAVRTIWGVVGLIVVCPILGVCCCVIIRIWVCPMPDTGRICAFN